MAWSYRLLLIGWIGALVVAVAGIGAIAVAMLHCYVPSVYVVDLHVCGPSLWGAAWVPVVGSIVGVSLIGCVLVQAALALRQQVSGATELGATLTAASMPAPERLTIAAEAAGAGDVVTCVRSDSPIALTIGARQPRIVVTDALVDLLDDDELQAVLRHEAVHAAKRHPARYSIARALAQSSWALPGMRSQAQRVVLQSEIDADRAAVTWVGRRPLVSALAKLHEVGPPGPEAAVGGFTGMLSARVHQLAGQPHDPPRSTPLMRFATFLGAGLLATPVVAMVITILRSRGIL